MSSFSLRWLAVGVFVLSSTLNFLDRSLLSTLAPLIMDEFHLTQSGFGWLISIFSIAYAAGSLFVGWFIDRVGINRSVSVAVGWWSAAALSTGIVQGLPGLAACRAALGLGESAGVPAVGKLNGMYLKPEERALGAAVNQIGISLGLSIAPFFLGIARAYTWRMPFMVAGLLGFLWIPLWLLVSRVISPQHREEITLSKGQRGWAAFSILQDRSLLLLALANVLWMPSYSLWSNWTTLYLIHVQHLTLDQTPAYVWIPSFVSIFGGFFGGWLSLAWMRRSVKSVAARQRAIWVSMVGLLITLVLPLTTNARWATAVISLSFFFALAGSVNIYAIPIDLYGPARSGLAIATLVFAYGVMQMVLSPVVGYMGDHHLYTQIVWLVTLPPVLGALVLLGVRPKIVTADAHR